MSAFFIFEIKRTKSNKIFNFFKDYFTEISGFINMFFGVFLETNVRLLKNCNFYQNIIAKVTTY